MEANQEEPSVDSLTHFGQDVLEGLSSKPKRLSSRYFYDAVGDKLFQQIMELEEYYPTRTELEIFQTQKEGILRELGDSFRIIELGAGDGLKTKVLLKYFVAQSVSFTYSPVDISADILEVLKKSLIEEIPELNVEPLPGDYFHVMQETVSHDEQRNVVFFLGSNIGNYSDELRSDFLAELRANLKVGDLVLMGFDLKKHPQTILDAYNDSKGVTTAFNKNLLTRINAELGGNFDVDKFHHFPSYNPDTGECISYLLSIEDQDVKIEALDEVFHFHEWEPVFMEVSKKFDSDEMRDLAHSHGFAVNYNFMDAKSWFADSVWEAV